MNKLIKIERCVFMTKSGKRVKKTGYLVVRGKDVKIVQRKSKNDKIPSKETAIGYANYLIDVYYTMPSGCRDGEITRMARSILSQAQD